MKLLTYLILSISILSVFSTDKVKLTDVQVLTLHQGKWTNGRRSSGVPQLECTGGSANCLDKYTPRVVQCTNMGSDGYDVQWTCNAELGTNLKFGKMDVNCEGYDHPNDKYVLIGSCGLRYTLDISSSGGKYYQNETSEKKSFNGIYFLIFCVIVCFVIYYFFISPNTNGFQDASTPNVGYPGEAPPPPGFRQDYSPPPPYESTYRYKGPNSTRQTHNDGPGFWTGLGAGGLLGYLFGTGTNQRSTHQYYQPTTDYSVPHSSRRDYHSASTTYRPFDTDESQEYRTASGYGGTSRR